MDQRVLNEYAVVIKQFIDKGDEFTAFDVTSEVRKRLPGTNVPHYLYRQHIHDTLGVYDIDSSQSLIHNGAILYQPDRQVQIPTPAPVVKAADVTTAKPVSTITLQPAPKTAKAGPAKVKLEFTERKLPDARGRYTITNKVVRAAGLKPGDTVNFKVDGQRLVLDNGGNHSYTVDNDSNIRINARLINAAKTKLTTRFNPATKQIVVLY
jgi:uncharacterized ParB-like nuclease family protein